MYQKVQNIKNLQANDVVNDIFVIKAKRGMQSYANDTKYRFELRLGDATSEINLKFWGGESEEEVKEIMQNYKREDAIFNIVGENSCKLALEIGLVKKEGVARIQGVPVAFALL